MFNLSRYEKAGGPEGARTPDLIHAMDALFQLRYRPILVAVLRLRVIDVHSLYAITGVPTSARLFPGTPGEKLHTYCSQASSASLFCSLAPPGYSL